MVLLTLTVILSIAVSFLCSILEATLLSLTPTFISQQKERSPQLYLRLKALRDKIDRPLVAILTLNTIAHTAGAAGVGAQVTALYGSAYLGVASAVMTILILILSEIIPKVLGAKYWRQIAPTLPGILNPMILILRPFIWLSDRILRIIGNNREEINLRAEIKALSQLAKELGKIETKEQQVIANVLDLNEVDITSIMTPRVVTTAIKPDIDPQELTDLIEKHQFSRYPIIDDEENPLGIFFRHDLLKVAQGGEKIMDLAEEPLVFPDTISVKNAFRKLLDEQQHLAFIYDEYGTWLGIITLEDILEKLIGEEILDEHDLVPDMRLLAKKRWESRKESELGKIKGKSH